MAIETIAILSDQYVLKNHTWGSLMLEIASYPDSAMCGAFRTPILSY
jgi:hypothetical protein